MRSPEELTEVFHQRGLKVTPQRQLVFRLLHDSETHPTAEAVYQLAVAVMPTMSLRTVYQTLNDLAAMGEIHALDLGTGSSRFDPNVDTHHHLVCVRCGRVRDVYADAGAVALPDAGEHDFTIEATEIVFRGHCRDCTVETDSPSHSQSRHLDSPQGDIHG